jgi:signal transduction histidine kinase
MQLRGAQLQVKEQATPQLDPALQPQLQLPLTFEAETLGLWTIGPRRDEEDFSREDRRILQALRHQAAIAVSNMLLVKGMQDQLAEIRANRELLAQVDRKLFITREEERARLARDLHDGPVQSLIALNLKLGMIQPAGGENPVQAMRDDVKGVIFDLRTLCAELRPPMLDTMGLGAALRDLAQNWSSQNNIAVTIDLPPDADLRPLPDKAAVNLYRVAQEALSNIARHAEASRVNLCLEWVREASLLTMIVQDNGKGFVFDPDHITVAENHLGLINMRERVGLFGGEWNLETSPGQGTRITATWRIPQ